MTTLLKPSFLAGVLILSLSCGPAKAVQYVYVDNPVYDPAPLPKTQGFTVDNSSVVPTEKNQNSQSLSSPTSSGQVFQKVADHERCQMLADEYVAGVYRGYGYARKMNLNAARGSARQIATTEALRKIKDVITDVTHQLSDDVDDRYLQSISSKAKTYRITNPITVCSATSQSNGYYEVSMCIQMKAEDLLDFLEEEINQLPKSAREQFENTVINYNALMK